MRSKGFLLNSGKVHSEFQARWLRFTSSSETNCTAIFSNTYSQHCCTNKSSWSTSNWMYIFHVFWNGFSFIPYIFCYKLRPVVYIKFYIKYWVEPFFGLTKQTPALRVGGNGFIYYSRKVGSGLPWWETQRKLLISGQRVIAERMSFSLCLWMLWYKTKTWTKG